ncbi:MAG: hypothetical protein GF308_09600 [Candidatus Heimdallarchaeota archaeon]|nr:hypothetical protein [Candidatus Heimdallarchaeota archaeon]
MSEIVIRCDSSCISCPLGRVLAIRNYKEKRLVGVYYCPNCDKLSICKRGIGFRINTQKKLEPVCTNCRRELVDVSLRYVDERDNRPFNSESLIIIRQPMKNEYTIIKILKSVFFDDLAEILLYSFFLKGEGEYNIVNYEKKQNRYKVIFSGFISLNKIEIYYDPVALVRRSYSYWQ